MIAMRCSAALSCRLPPRASRWPVGLAGRGGDRRDTGVHGETRLGAEPADVGRLADDLGRGERPAAGQRQQLRGESVRPAPASSCSSVVDPSGERRGCRRPSSLAKPPNQRAVQLLKPGLQPVRRVAAQVQAAGPGSSTRIELVQVPAQPVLDAGPLGDQVLPVVDQQPYLPEAGRRARRPAGPARAARPERWPARRSDRTCRGLRARAGSRGHQLRGHPHHPLAGDQQVPLQPARDVTAVLDAPSSARPAELRRPTPAAGGARRRWPGPSSVAQRPAGLVDGHRRVWVRLWISIPTMTTMDDVSLLRGGGRLGTGRRTHLSGGACHAPIKSRRSALTSGDRHNP